MIFKSFSDKIRRLNQLKCNKKRLNDYNLSSHLIIFHLKKSELISLFYEKLSIKIELSLETTFKNWNISTKLKSCLK